MLAGGSIPLLFQSFRARLSNMRGLDDFLSAYSGVLAFSGILAILGGLGSFLFAGQALIYVSVVVLGVGSWFYVPALLTIPMRLSGATQERVAAVWGSYMTFSGLGMFIFPIPVGWMYDSSNSYYPSFVICALASWALLICGLFLPKESASTAPNA